MLDRFKKGPTFLGVKPEVPISTPSSPAAVVSSPTTFPLRVLEAQLTKVVTITTEEIETDPAEGDCVGKYVWRDEKGHGFFWSPTPVRYTFEDVETLAEADEIMFLCPLCFAKNGGSNGTHSVMVSFAGRNVPDEAGSRDADGKPSRWTIAGGSSLDDLVLTPSILLDAKQPAHVGCHWHGFVGSNGIPPGHAG